MTSDLESARGLDLATVALDYDAFQRLARNPNLSPNERIGFPESYRANFDDAIVADLRRKLPTLDQNGRTIVDIGPGCAGVPRRLIDLCARQGHRLVLVDSPAMLEQLPDGEGITKVSGPFPSCLQRLQAALGGPADALICYSVLHYMFVETNVFDVVDAVMDVLGPGGEALIGDVPNASKRRRFFSSPNGQAFHRAFMNTDEAPSIAHLESDRGRINDAVLTALVQRCQLAGCDAYLLPQPSTLPMWNRRDDLLIRRP